MAGQGLVRPISLYEALFPVKENARIIKLDDLIGHTEQCQIQHEESNSMHASQTQLGSNLMEEELGATVGSVHPREFANITWSVECEPGEAVKNTPEAMIEIVELSQNVEIIENSKHSMGVGDVRGSPAIEITHGAVAPLDLHCRLLQVGNPILPRVESQIGGETDITLCPAWHESARRLHPDRHNLGFGDATSVASQERQIERNRIMLDRNNVQLNALYKDIQELASVENICRDRLDDVDLGFLDLCDEDDEIETLGIVELRRVFKRGHRQPRQSPSQRLSAQLKYPAPQLSCGCGLLTCNAKAHFKHSLDEFEELCVNAEVEFDEDLVAADAEPSNVVVAKSPNQPSDKEIEEHFCSGHTPPRSWCQSCIAGRGKVDDHRKTKGADNPHDFPTWHCDYCYLGSKKDWDTPSHADDLPILVAKDDKHLFPIAHCVPCKGTEHPWPAKIFGADLAACGYPKFALKSDQERALVALKRKAVDHVRELQSSVEVVPEESPVGSSQSNGFIEQFVWTLTGLLRTLKHSAEQLHGVKIPPSHPALAWRIEYAAQVLAICHRSGGDGKTAWERRRGKKYQKPMVPWLEAIMYQPEEKKRMHKYDDRACTGLFLALVPRSNEVVVGTPHGVVKARSVRRLPPLQRKNVELVNALQGVPWQPDPKSGDDRIRVRISAEPVVADADLPPPVLPQGPISRSFTIRRDVELKDFWLHARLLGLQGCARGNRAENTFT